VRDLDGLIKVRDLGADRCGTSGTVAILDEYRKRAAQGDLESEKKAATLGTGGY
jgi:deoxyribose-phosphate aldolase